VKVSSAARADSRAYPANRTLAGAFVPRRTLEPIPLSAKATTRSSPPVEIYSSVPAPSVRHRRGHPRSANRLRTRHPQNDRHGETACAPCVAFRPRGSSARRCRGPRLSRLDHPTLRGLPEYCFRQPSTVSTALIAASRTPVWPTMSQFAKLTTIRSNSPALIASSTTSRDPVGAHLRLLVVRADFAGRRHHRRVSRIRFLHAAVEEVGHVRILFALGDAQLL
jgi:hypothetical protein